MWSWESTATPETWPRIQLFGRCFGQYGSGSYLGSGGAAAARPAIMNPIKVRAARVCDLITDLRAQCAGRKYITDVSVGRASGAGRRRAALTRVVKYHAGG